MRMVVGESALHMACFRGHLRIAQMLVEQKADVNASNKVGARRKAFGVI